MVEIVKSGGWLMLPIILCAIVAMGIILERFWTLRQKRVIPEDLTSKVWGWVKKEQLDQKQIQTLHQGSALGQILAAGLINRDRDRVVLKDAIEDTGRHVVHELERYLETLGTVAAVSPLLGLLGSGAHRLSLLSLARRYPGCGYGKGSHQARRGTASSQGKGIVSCPSLSRESVQ
jgi:biopolymer transport protein ExbB